MIRSCSTAAVLAATVLLAGCHGRRNTVVPGPGHSPHAAGFPGTPEVVVDFAAPVAGARSRAGFLHGLGDRQPHDSLISALRPAMWRIGKPSDYDRLVRAFPDPASRPRITFLLSDQWGYPSYDGSHGWPHEDWAAWEAFVRRTARVHRGKQMLWEVWNEPDNPVFWKGTQAQFRETYLRAFRVLRQVLGPDVMVGGPSYSSYTTYVDPQGLSTHPLMREFLAYCQANGCEANFLTWHELHPDIPPVEQRARELRALAREYPAVAVRELHAGETVGERNHYRPAEQLGTLYYVERGNVDASPKTCWEDSGGASTCFNQTLDGLLTPSGLRRTAGWWAYKSYADGAASRVASTTNHPYVVALGSTRSATPGQAQVLIASLGYREAPASKTVRLSLRNIGALPSAQGSAARIRVQRIPNSGEAAVRGLTPVSDSRYSLVSGSFTLSIAIGVHEAVLVTVDPRPGGW
jgi:hypothetical protein